MFRVRGHGAGFGEFSGAEQSFVFFHFFVVVVLDDSDLVAPVPQLVLQSSVEREVEGDNSSWLGAVHEWGSP